MILREFDLFKGFDFEIMQEIAKICIEQNHPINKELFIRGDHADRVYILFSGSIKLLIEDGGSISYTISEPGEMFGWSSMLDHGKYTASAICVTEVKTVMIEKAKLDRILQEHPEVGYKFIKRLAGTIAKRLTYAYQDLLSAGRTARVASYG